MFAKKEGDADQKRGEEVDIEEEERETLTKSGHEAEDGEEEDLQQKMWNSKEKNGNCLQ